MDTAPVFDNPDPFVWRFKVEPLVVLDLQHSIPSTMIHLAAPLYDEGYRAISAM